MADPLLLVDVDGVLFPWQAAECPEGFEEIGWPGEEPAWLAHRHGVWLRRLATRYELVWASGWGHDANRLVAPVLGLPALPVIEFPPVPFPPAAKVPAIAQYVADRPAAWIDDQLTAAAHGWAAARPHPTLLLVADAAVGMTLEHVTALEEWAVSLR